MQSAFGTVIWVVCAVGLLGALAALITGAKTWEEFGKNRLLLDRDAGPAGPKPGSSLALLEREAEIRQMLEARNARRARRGEPPVNVETELRRLTAPQIDEGLRAEIRQMVIARNHRRARQGKAPLDVAAEIEREIESLHSQSHLDPLG